MLLQEFLRTGGTLTALAEIYAIKSVRHQTYPNLVLFKYSQIASDMSLPIVQESRGVILDEADGWRVVSRAYDKFFNYGEPNAAEIDWTTAVVQEKVDGCFEARTRLDTWGGSQLTISEIVNQGKRPVLIGMDDNGNLVPAQIIAVSKNGTKNHWLQVLAQVKNRKSYGLKVTVNHSLYLNGAYRPASGARAGDTLVTYRRAPDPSVLHMMRSGLLGDGCITLNGDGARYCDVHQAAHGNYLNFIEHWLGECAISSRQVTSGYGSHIVHVTSRTYDQLAVLREEWYASEVKCVPSDLTWMDDFAVAKWFMDNGSLSSWPGQLDRACFATNGFQREEVVRLASRLEEMYGVSCTVYNAKGWTIRIKSGRHKEIDRFWAAVAPHVVPGMRYKLPCAFRDVPYVRRPRGCELYVPQPCAVVSVELLSNSKQNFPQGRQGYDIQTTTGNYMAQGVLVHNSLCSVYEYAGARHVATTGTPDAGGPVNSTDTTFAALFWETLGLYLGEDWETPPWENANWCYLFELTTPHNRVIVNHLTAGLTLLGIRDRVTGQWVKTSDAAMARVVPPVREYALQSFADIQATFDGMDPLAQEGYVVVDAQGRRVKVKHPGYVALHHMKDGATEKSMLEVIQRGEVPEVTAHFPEIAGAFGQIKTRYDALASAVDAAYLPIKSIETQKEFAASALPFPYSAALFDIRRGKAADGRDFLAKATLPNLMRLLGMREELQEDQSME